MAGIEATGVCEGLLWEIEMMPMGHRCGYVEIPKDHPLFGVQYHDLVIDVHGGLTFSGPRNETDDWWLGFDCNHPGDARDLSKVTHISDKDKEIISIIQAERGGVVRSVEYVRMECEKLARQINEWT